MKWILLSLLVLLTSCETVTTPPPPRQETEFVYVDADDEPISGNSVHFDDGIKVSEGYLYLSLVHTEGIGGMNPVSFYDYVRLNLKTGNVTSVCPDPVCSHSSVDCVFYGNRGTIVLPGQKFLTVQREGRDAWGNPGIHRLSFYDMKRNQQNILQEYGHSTMFAGEVYTASYRFYVEEDYNEELDAYERKTMRMEVDSGKILPIPEAEGTVPLFTVNERIYFTGGQTLFSLNLNGEDKTDHFSSSLTGRILTDGSYAYYISRGQLCRRLLENGEEEQLGITPSEYRKWQLSGDYIYYFTGEDVAIGTVQMSGWGGNKAELIAPELRRCRHDGSEDTLIYSFAEGQDGVWYDPIDGIPVGNYYYCYYARWEDKNGNGVFEDGERQISLPNNGSTRAAILRIDVTTGERYEWVVAE